MQSESRVSVLAFGAKAHDQAACRRNALHHPLPTTPLASIDMEEADFATDVEAFCILKEHYTNLELRMHRLIIQCQFWAPRSELGSKRYSWLQDVF